VRCDRDESAGDRECWRRCASKASCPPDRPAVPLGPNGLSAGEAVNELSPIVLDPNAQIQEVNAFAADILARVPGGEFHPSGAGSPGALRDERLQALLESVRGG
jgi:hypothetical protein